VAFCHVSNRGLKGFTAVLFYVIVFTVVLIDQVSKRLINLYMRVGDTIQINSFLHFTFYENSGMARSMFQGYARLFALAAVLFIAGILYYRGKGFLRGRLQDISTGLLVGGAAGNAIDRILFGKVTDFLEFRPGGGILNLADIAINIGVIAMILAMVVNYIKEKRMLNE
jgi:signal peptidase II